MVILLVFFQSFFSELGPISISRPTSTQITIPQTPMYSGRSDIATKSTLTTTQDWDTWSMEVMMKVPAISKESEVT